MAVALFLNSTVYGMDVCIKTSLRKPLSLGNGEDRKRLSSVIHHVIDGDVGITEDVQGGSSVEENEDSRELSSSRFLTVLKVIRGIGMVVIGAGLLYKAKAPIHEFAGVLLFGIGLVTLFSIAIREAHSAVFTQGKKYVTRDRDSIGYSLQKLLRQGEIEIKSNSGNVYILKIKPKRQGLLDIGIFDSTTNIQMGEIWISGKDKELFLDRWYIYKHSRSVELLNSLVNFLDSICPVGTELFVTINPEDAETYEEVEKTQDKIMNAIYNKWTKLGWEPIATDNARAYRMVKESYRSDENIQTGRVSDEVMEERFEISEHGLSDERDNSQTLRNMIKNNTTRSQL